jgi:hypothetical protein
VQTASTATPPITSHLATRWTGAEYSLLSNIIPPATANEASTLTAGSQKWGQNGHDVSGSNELRYTNIRSFPPLPRLSKIAHPRPRQPVNVNPRSRWCRRPAHAPNYRGAARLGTRVMTPAFGPQAHSVTPALGVPGSIACSRPPPGGVFYMGLRTPNTHVLQIVQRGNPCWAAPALPKTTDGLRLCEVFCNFYHHTAANASSLAAIICSHSASWISRSGSLGWATSQVMCPLHRSVSSASASVIRSLVCGVIGDLP